MQNQHKHHQNLFSALLPTAWTDSFEITDIEESDIEWHVVLTEKKTCIPQDLHGKETVLNGYLPPLELIDFPFRGKLMHLRFIRRRWKEPNHTESYQNPDYSFHPAGAMVTNDFGAFLKEFTREEFAELCHVWPSLRNYW